MAVSLPVSKQVYKTISTLMIDSARLFEVNFKVYDPDQISFPICGSKAQEILQRVWCASRDPRNGNRSSRYFASSLRLRFKARIAAFKSFCSLSASFAAARFSLAICSSRVSCSPAFET
jgi:hypothetical protein